MIIAQYMLINKIKSLTFHDKNTSDSTLKTLRTICVKLSITPMCSAVDCLPNTNRLA